MATVTRLWSGTTTTWITAANWLPAAAPLDTDIVIIGKGAAYGLAGVSAYTSYPVGGTLGSFTLEAGNGNNIGTRDIPLVIAATVVNLYGTGTVYLTGTLTTLNLAIGTGFNIVEVEGVSPTMTNLNMLSGAARITTGAIATCVVTGGTLTYGEPGKTATAITTLTIEGSGKVVYNSNQTITTLNLRKGGTLDLSGDTRAVTITTLNLSPGARIIDPNKRLTITTLTPLEGLTLSAS